MSDESLTLDEALDSVTSEPQPGEASEQPEDDQDSEQAQADKHEPEDHDEDDGEQERAEDPQEDEPEVEEEEDDRPEWDKDDEDEDDDADKAEDGGRYASPKAKVRLPDGSEVKVGDLIENGLRHSDYTRKSQEVAQMREHTERQFSELQQLNQQIEQQQQLIMQAAQSFLPAPPTSKDWQEDPVGAGQRKAQYDEAVQYLQGLNQQMQGHQQQMTQAQQQQYYQAQTERTQQELDSLYRAMPQLRDQRKAAAFTQDVATGLSQHYGYQPDELSTIVDHRNILVAADALRYRRMMANKTDAKANVPAAKKGKSQAPVTRGGKRLSSDEARQRSVSRVEDKLGKARSLDMDQAVDLLIARKRG